MSAGSVTFLLTRAAVLCLAAVVGFLLEIPGAGPRASAFIALAIALASLCADLFLFRSGSRVRLLMLGSLGIALAGAIPLAVTLGLHYGWTNFAPWATLAAGLYLGRGAGVWALRSAGAVSTAGALHVVDTSALIDGRIAGVADAGFLTGTLIVPRAVLDELQNLADSPDGSKRVRARRGLDIVKHLQEHSRLRIEMADAKAADKEPVDRCLLELAKKRGATLVTTDFNLGKVAAIEGVAVLNVNELAGAVRFPAARGETLDIVIERGGTELGQGVGYLEDGTMVVVEGGKRAVGRSVRVTVTSVLQTAAGKMVFARMDGPAETKPRPISAGRS